MFLLWAAIDINNQVSGAVLREIIPHFLICPNPYGIISSASKRNIGGDIYVHKQKKKE